jgi:methylmalonyl-CoA mutase N-terminal domain/subunit
MDDVSKVAESGFEIKRVYGPDTVTADQQEKLGEPGAYPFTRHIYPTGYRARSWQPSLYSGFGDPHDANRRFRYLLEQGNGRANIAFDLPTQLGFDCDDPEVADEVGRVGVSISSLADFEALFDGVPLDQIPISMNISSLAPVMVAMLAATASKQGVDLAKIRGTIANDIGHEFVSRGAWIYPVVPSFRLMGDTAEFVIGQMPGFYPFNIRGILLHEQGAAAPQELGYAFAIALSYVEALLDRGLGIDDFAPRISFFFGTGLHVFEEAAKFRAGRRLWAQTMREQYGAQDPRSHMMRFTCVATCGSYFTAQLPELNLVRSTLGVMGAALGGAQAMLGTTMDEAYDIPTEFAQLLALRTQQIVALESDVTSTVDPLGGSYFVEAMTDEIESMSRDVIARVRRGSGGVIGAIEDGTIQLDIESRAYRVKRELDDGSRPWVGVNVHEAGSEQAHDMASWKPDTRVVERRIEALKDVRSQRSSRAVDDALTALTHACRSSASVMPAMIQATEAYATVGEISGVLQEAFGSFLEPVSS